MNTKSFVPPLILFTYKIDKKQLIWFENSSLIGKIELATAMCKLSKVVFFFFFHLNAYQNHAITMSPWVQ